MWHIPVEAMGQWAWTQEVHHSGRISQVKWRFSQIRKSNSWFVQFIQLILTNTQCFSTTTRFTDQQKSLCRKSLYNYSRIRVVSVFFTCFLRVKTKPLFHDLQIAVKKPLFHVRHTSGAFKFMWPSSQIAFCLRTQEIHRIRKLRNETAKIKHRTIAKKKTRILNGLLHHPGNSQKKSWHAFPCQRNFMSAVRTSFCCQHQLWRSRVCKRSTWLLPDKIVLSWVTTLLHILCRRSLPA